MLGWASQSKWPHLLRAISLMPAVGRLRWKGPGSEGCAEMVAAARRSSWHGWEGTAGLALAAAHSRPAFAQARVIRLSSGFRCLITFPWCTHIRHRTRVSACNERFDSWRATEAEVMELLQIWSWLMLMGKLKDGVRNYMSMCHHQVPLFQKLMIFWDKLYKTGVVQNQCICRLNYSIVHFYDMEVLQYCAQIRMSKIYV